MPTFYEGKPIEVFEQHISTEEYAAAYSAAQEAISPIHKKEVKLGVCLLSAIAIGFLIPIYRTWFLTFWLPAFGMMLALSFGIFFYFVQPNDIKKWADKLYHSNAILILPEKISLYRDSVIVENPYEQFMEYWTDFVKCVENKSAFVVIGGLERDLLIIKKKGLTDEQKHKISAHFADAFASRYLKSGC